MSREAHRESLIPQSLEVLGEAFKSMNLAFRQEKGPVVYFCHFLYPLLPICGLKIQPARLKYKPTVFFTQTLHFQKMMCIFSVLDELRTAYSLH